MLRKELYADCVLAVFPAGEKLAEAGDGAKAVFAAMDNTNDDDGMGAVATGYFAH